jgi:hypothetical protein
MGLNTQYAREIHEQFGYLATWLPTANIQVGDVGSIQDGIFEKSGSLKDHGISFSSHEDPQTGDIEYASSDAVTIEVIAAGAGSATALAGSIVTAKASIAVSFRRANAVLFQASKCRTISISNLSVATSTILDQYRAGKWPKDLVVVTEVVIADAATILISSGAGAHIKLSAKADLGASEAKLANADAGLTVDSSSAIGTHIIAQKGTTPLFKAGGIKTSLLWEPEFKKKGADDLEFAPLTLSDLERAG